MAKAPTTNKKINIPSSKIDLALAAGKTADAVKSSGAATGKVYSVPVAAVKVIPGFNVRVDSPAYRDRISALASMIETNGYDETKPLAGYVAKEGDDNVIYVTDGHTRLAAVNDINARAGEDGGPTAIDKVPVIVRTTAPSMVELTLALHTANSGEPLSPFELGVVVKRLLKEDGADKAVIAKQLGVSGRYLDDVLLLVNSPKEVRTAVLEGQVSSTLAIGELRKAGDTPAKAVERITAAVDKAKAAGKTKATAKDVGIKMQKVRNTVSIATGTTMKEIVKAVAAYVREAIQATGEGDEKSAAVDGTINLVIEVPAPADPIKAAAAEKPAKAAKAPKADKKPAKAKKAAAEKAPAEEPKGPAVAGDTDDDDSDDLGIPGATPSREDEDLNLPLPPAVKNGEGADGDEVDI